MERIIYIIKQTHMRRIRLEEQKIAGNEQGVFHPATTELWKTLGLGASSLPRDASELRGGSKDTFIFVGKQAVKQAYDISRYEVLTLGGMDTDTIQLEDSQETDILLKREADGWHVSVTSDERVFVNMLRITDETKVIVGDLLFCAGVELEICESELNITDYTELMTTELMLIGEARSLYSADYPEYHRSPRFIYPLPEDEITILKPPSPPTKPTDGLWKLLIPPLTMMGMTVMAQLIQPRGIYALIGLATTVITSITSIVTFMNNKKKYKKEMAAAEVTYTTYIKKKNKEIADSVKKQRDAMFYHLPTIETLTELVEKVDNRIFEKTIYHHDFLEFRMGLADTEPSFKIKYDIDEMNDKKEPLVEMADDLKKSYETLPKLPYAVSLKQGAVGFIGSRPHVLEQLQLMLAQLSVFHSYHDLELITVFPEREKEQWDWARWLPQASMREVNIRGFVYHDRSRDQVLSSLYQILKARRQAKDEKNSKDMVFSPHYVVTITDETLVVDHSIMELMKEGIEELGVSLIFVEEHVESLAEYVKTVIDIRDAKEATIILENGEMKNKKVILDHFPVGFDKERISRSLAPLEHLLTLTNTIPESVTFLELYNVKQIEELQIGARWAKNAPHKSLAVPLGLRGKDDIVNLNLHEKAHGPHGLVAGTTGSGKSEIVQSYILSLAVNFHPYDVAFLLIDYKGGGMANLFKDLPHHLGSITNLDGAQSMRALISIKAELQRRQRLFSENDVNHINQYQKLFKEGAVSDPMPHLFLISDEFAELKSEQPEFMKELVSTARIGRSLGIHLILATQKPSGVVDDQIWSNSKFKLALKVQDVGDSNEMLKTPDAASITLPGRAYLQVGNNEIYELFQSAWSGASYYKDREEKQYVDDTIYKINALGQYEILSEDLSGLEKEESVGKVETELEAIISFLDVYTTEQGIPKLPQPWLPPLEKRFVIESKRFNESWSSSKPSMLVEVGVIDQPHIQAQNPFTIDLTKDGHLAVLSSPGFGKSTTLQTITMQLARLLSPEQLHVYLLDFGTNGLLALKHLPHVADTIQVDEEEKIHKLVRRLTLEIKERKAKLSEYSVASLTQYESASGMQLPNIVVVIDNYDVIKDSDFSEVLQPLTMQISREGASVGIHLVMAATSYNAFKMAMQANIKLKLAQYMNDASDVSAIVGRSDFKIEETAGRGLVKLDQPTIYQMGLPAEGVDSLEMIDNMKREAEEMKAFFTGKLPLPIPMVPEVLHYNEFVKIPSVQEQVMYSNSLPIGIDFENVEAIVLDLSKSAVMLMSDMQDKSKKIANTVLTYLLSSPGKDITVVDSVQMPLSEYESKLKYFVAKEDVEKIIVDTYEELLQKEQTQSKVNIPRYLIFNHSKFLFSTLKENEQEKLLELVTRGHQKNIFIIIIGDYGTTNSGYGPLKKGISIISQVVLQMKATEQSLFTTDIKSYREDNLLGDEGYFVKDGKAVKMKTPQ